MQIESESTSACHNSSAQKERHTEWKTLGNEKTSSVTAVEAVREKIAKAQDETTGSWLPQNVGFQRIRAEISRKIIEIPPFGHRTFFFFLFQFNHNLHIRSE
jgi:hypothetical protein